MSQVYNRANAITIHAMDLVSCGLRTSVCELTVTLFPSFKQHFLPSFHSPFFKLNFSGLIRQIFLCRMEVQCEKTTAFSLQSIFNQVLKPLDVKTKFYNAEVSRLLSCSSTSISLIQSAAVNIQILCTRISHHAILQIEELYRLTR